MDTPPPILAYATPAAGVRVDDDRLILPQPPPGWEMTLLSIAILFCLLAILVGVGTSLNALHSNRRDRPMLNLSVPFTLAMIAAAVHFTRQFFRRRRFGRLPCTIQRLPDGGLLIHFPALWGERSRRFASREILRRTITRRGWAANLLALFELHLNVTTSFFERSVRIPFVTADANDAKLVQQQLAAMLQPRSMASAGA